MVFFILNKYCEHMDTNKLYFLCYKDADKRANNTTLA